MVPLNIQDKLNAHQTPFNPNPVADKNMAAGI